MKSLILIIYFSGIAFMANAQIIKVLEKNYGVDYRLMDGKMDGGYFSYYSNGRVKASGSFKNNLRTGIWTVYDSMGRKIHERNYTTDFLTFEKLYPEKEKNGPASLFDTSFHHPVKNEDGIIPYHYLLERAVIYSSRLWRNISSEDNPVFYKKDLLYNVVFNFVTDSSNLAYCSSDDDFSKQLFPSQLKSYSLNEYKIINWKIKEDFILDSDRMVSETRIIGICPVGVNKQTKDTSDLYWIYFPYLRKPLSQASTKIKNDRGEIQTLDDLFFFRNFASMIYKRLNVNNRELKDYCDTPGKVEKERNRIETELIETEHDFWLGKLPD